MFCKTMLGFEKTHTKNRPTSQQLSKASLELTEDTRRIMRVQGSHRTLFCRQKHVSSYSTIVVNLEGDGRKVSFETESDETEKTKKRKQPMVIRLPVKAEKLITKGTQTDYRESEAQTLPWKHEIKAETKILAELLLLDWFTLEKNFPPGLEEVTLTEKARKKLAWENIVERLRGKENEFLRKSLLLKLAVSETAFNEEKKDEEKQRRLAMSRQQIKEEHEAFEKKLWLRLQRSYDCLRREKECKTHGWNHDLTRSLRKMKSARKQSTTKSDIVTLHEDKTSQLYAPKDRDGENPSFGHEVIDIQCRYLKRFHGLEFLETRIAHILQPQFLKSGFETLSSTSEKTKSCLGKFRKKGEQIFLEFLLKRLETDAMIPSRYMLIDEKYPYSVKRRVRGGNRDGEREKEPAITLLPPDPYVIMERPNFVRSSSPTVYKTVPPKSARNKEASFVILGDTITTPVQSRPGSPSGRISPFRGHGFKSLSNTRAPSPSDSYKKDLLTGASKKPKKTAESPRIGRDIGLPPKSPMKHKPPSSEVRPTTISTAANLDKTTAKNEKADEGTTLPLEGEEVKTSEKNQITPPGVESSKEKEIPQTTEQRPETVHSAQQSQELPESPKKSETQMPAISKDKKPPAPPTVTNKANSRKKEGNSQESVVRKATKPPLPPKKIDLKATLKNDSTNENGKTNLKNGNQIKTHVKDPAAKKNEESSEDAKPLAHSKQNLKDSKKKEVKENSKETESLKVKENEEKKAEDKQGESNKATEVNQTEDKQEGNNKSEVKVEEKDAGKSEKVVPCFQPDKCQIAPPTMASPSPIITPTISTPSTTADLASSSMKNSQSIAAAPTAVTPSSLSSVSSTVVLTGNLVRKEIENRATSRETGSRRTDASAVGGKETRDPSSPDKMVKAARKDSLKWSDKDSLSKEVTSATKIIKAEPDMEVLSPNNLNDSPPRMPPPNLAWDENVVPNGDVPSKERPESKFRRFVSAVWRFLSCLFCCRCLSGCRCCPRSNRDGIPSKYSCCKGKTCRNPFKCCSEGCKSKCCSEGKKRRRNSKPGNSNPKRQKCCAKVDSSCRRCCDRMRDRCLDVRYKLNSVCRSLFCLNLTCCQRLLKKFKFCHKFKCCQKNGFCSCCNPNVKKEPRKLNKKGSHASSNSSDKDNLDVVLVEHTSLMKAAIPVLPSCLAAFCLILNLLVPGFGTFVSGILCLCFGKPRFSVKDTPKNRLGSFILNTIIAVAQLFTVVFCLVGWGWSIWWGVIIYKLSRRQKRLKLAEKSQKEAENSNINHNHVDVEQG